MLKELTVKDFIEVTASDSPAPGGGSIAALCGALSAALTEMVANLTIGKKKYIEVENDMISVIKKTEVVREKFLKNIDKDTEAFNRVMKAFKLPKSNEEEKKRRAVTIEEALKNAALIPLNVARDAFNLIPTIQKVIENGNKNALSDGLVAVMLARTTVLSALYNVKINLSSIKDEDFVSMYSLEVNQLEKEVQKKEQEILMANKLI